MAQFEELPAAVRRGDYKRRQGQERGTGDRVSMDARTRDVLPGGARHVGGDPGIDALTVTELALEIFDRLPLGAAFEQRRRPRLICVKLLG